MDDLTWIPNTLIAIGTLISSIVAAVMAIRASSKAAEAKSDALGAKEQSVATHTAVNSGLDKLLKLIKDGAVAQATLDEKSAQAERQAAINGAITVERDKASATAAAIAASAAATAASVAATTALGKPVEVEVKAGPGVDQPLIVRGDKK